MGSLFAQKIIRCSREEFVAWVRKFSVSVVGSSPKGLMSYKTIDYRRPLVLLIGGERSGLSPQLLETCDIVVRIPMRGRCDSINAAVAAGVLLFEIACG
jgi:TrmH family RNA methyltransferase